METDLKETFQVGNQDSKILNSGIICTICKLGTASSKTTNRVVNVLQRDVGGHFSPMEVEGLNPFKNTHYGDEGNMDSAYVGDNLAILKFSIYIPLN